MFETIFKAIQIAADVTEIIVGVVALIIAWTQRDKISAVFSHLQNYSLRMSISDFRHWIEELSVNNVDDPEQSKRVRIALANIAGMIKGNDTLKKHLGSTILKQILGMVESLDDNLEVKESAKISLCREIKERVSFLEIKSHDDKSKQKIV